MQATDAGQTLTGCAGAGTINTLGGTDSVDGRAGTTDKVTAEYFFYNNDPANTYNPLQQVKFSDGTSWDIAAMKAKMAAPASSTNGSLDSAAQGLIQAMSSFAPSASADATASVLRRDEVVRLAAPLVEFA